MRRTALLASTLVACTSCVPVSSVSPKDIAANLDLGESVELLAKATCDTHARIPADAQLLSSLPDSLSFYCEAFTLAAYRMQNITDTNPSHARETNTLIQDLIAYIQTAPRVLEDFTQEVQRLSHTSSQKAAFIQTGIHDRTNEMNSYAHELTNRIEQLQNSIQEGLYDTTMSR